MNSSFWSLLGYPDTSSSAPAAPGTAARPGTVSRGRRVSIVEGASKAEPKDNAQVEAKERSLVQIVIAVTMIALGILLFFTFYHVFAFVGAGLTSFKLYEWLNPPASEDPVSTEPSVQHTPVNQSLDSSLDQSNINLNASDGSPLVSSNKDRFSI